MSLSQRINIGKTHREQHQQGETNLLEDPSCSTCHPPQFPISTAFERFWNFYSRFIAPTAEDYSEITIQRYLQVQSFAILVQRRGYISETTSTILQQYQQVLHTIYYRAELRQTTEQLAIITVLTGLVSDQFERDPSAHCWEYILSFRNPLLNDRPHFRAFEQILQAYQETDRTSRSHTGIAPLVPPFTPVEVTRPDTPLDGLESEVTSVTSSADKTSEEDTESFNGNLTASETRQNTQYNTIISLTEQLTLGETSATTGHFQEREQEQVREPFDEYDIALFETIYPRPPSPFQPLPLYVPQK